MRKNKEEKKNKKCRLWLAILSVVVTAIVTFILAKIGIN